MIKTFFCDGNIEGVLDELDRAVNEFEADASIEVLSVSDPCAIGDGVAITVRYRERPKAAQPMEVGDDLSIRKNTRALEEMLIRKALAQVGGNRTKAAELLKISGRAILYKIREFGIKD